MWYVVAAVILVVIAGIFAAMIFLSKKKNQ